jgi:transcriptional regulator with XRE-family HTH domain
MDGLGDALKGLRERAGLTTRALAEALGWSQGRVSRVELGHVRATAEMLDAWASATGASSEERAGLTTLAQDVTSYTARPWKTVHSEGLATTQRDIARVESAMTGLMNFQCALIPGLLQTAAYAQRDLEVADVSGQGKIGEAVAARMRRQEILYEPGRRTFDFVITQAALWPFFPATRELLRSQADRLVSAMTLPGVSVSVIPASAQPEIPYLSSFTIFEVPDDPVILVEIMSTELLLGGEWDVNLYRDTFTRLRAHAVTGEAAAGLIREVMTR